MATEARAKLFAFKMGGGETVIETQHRFSTSASECAIQGVPEPDAILARILMTYPSDRWRQFVDTIALRQPLSSVAHIFASMKMLEERHNIGMSMSTERRISLVELVKGSSCINSRSRS